MKPKKNLVGEVFGRLTVLEKANKIHNTQFWLCVCSCLRKTTLIVAQGNLKNGHTKSCGCLKKECNSGYKHGYTGTPEYKAWRHMINRCYNVKTINYQNWGGRGIMVCDAWRHDFMAFFTEVGLKPSPNHSLDRINNDGNYEPGNVRWATRSEQNNNKRPKIYGRPINAKLTEEEVKNIRDIYKNGILTVKELSILYYISDVSIYNVVTYKTYKDVKDGN